MTTKKQIPTLDVDILKMAARILHACAGSGLYVLAEDGVHHVKLEYSGFRFTGVDNASQREFVEAKDIVNCKILIFDDEAKAYGACADILDVKANEKAASMRNKAMTIREEREKINTAQKEGSNAE